MAVLIIMNCNLVKLSFSAFVVTLMQLITSNKITGVSAGKNKCSF